MKKSMIKRIFLLALVSMSYLLAGAQGVVVCKKDGTKIKVPYAELDSISTYNYEEDPQSGYDGKAQTFTANGVSFTMMPVEGGEFTMGSNYFDDSDEAPTHRVTLRSYMIGETEVTQELWQAVMGYKPTSDGRQWYSSYGIGAQYPAYYISWDDVQEFITKLNSITGQTFRMPTEAEWEYAALGGNKSKGYKYSGSNILDDVAWYNSNSGDKIHPVKTKSPNELGIYDMSGNVYEWCYDWYGSYGSSAQTDPTGPPSGSMRVYRGGAWFHNMYGGDNVCRVANREKNYPTYRNYTIGFRLAL